MGFTGACFSTLCVGTVRRPVRASRAKFQLWKTEISLSSTVRLRPLGLLSTPGLFVALFQFLGNDSRVAYTSYFRQNLIPLDICANPSIRRFKRRPRKCSNLWKDYGHQHIAQFLIINNFIYFKNSNHYVIGHVWVRSKFFKGILCNGLALVATLFPQRSRPPYLDSVAEIVHGCRATRLVAGPTVGSNAPLSITAYPDGLSEKRIW